MAKKVLLLATAMLCLGSAFATNGDSSSMKTFLSNIKVHASDSKSRKYATIPVALLLLAWRIAVAYKDVKASKVATRISIEDAQNTSDKVLTTEVLSQFASNLFRGLTLQQRMIGTQKAPSGNKLNTLTSWLMVLALIERAHACLPFRTEV